MSDEAPTPEGDDRLLEQPVNVALLRMGLPLALGMASHVVFNLVDLALIGQLVGEKGVAAAGPATTWNFVPMIFGNGISVVALSLMSRHLGAGARDRARGLSSWSQGFMVILGLVLGGILAATASLQIDSLGVEGEVRDGAIAYLVVSSIGTFSMFALIQTTTSMRACGEVAMPLILLLGSNVVNIVLDYLLLAGVPEIGLEPMGVVGAAWASFTSRVLAIAVAYWWLARPNHPLALGGLAHRDPADGVAVLVRQSVPQSLQMLVRVGAALGLMAIAGRLGGDAALAAVTTTSRLDSMILLGAVGYASAATALAGRAFAARREGRLRAVAVNAGMQTLLFGGVLVAVFALWIRVLVNLFIDDASPAVHEHAASYMRIAALGHPFAALAIAVGGAIHGTGRMWSPVMLDAFGFGLLLLPTLVLSGVLSEELIVPWVGFAVANLGIAALYLWHAKVGRWARLSD